MTPPTFGNIELELEIGLVYLVRSYVSFERDPIHFGQLGQLSWGAGAAKQGQHTQTPLHRTATPLA